MRKQIDNRSLTAKIALRVWLLQRMNLLDDVRVLDACSGEGLIWSEMEQHATIKMWTRCDIRPRPGADGGMILRMSAVQSISSLDLNDFNVVDIDTYGEPWEAYYALLTRITKPMAVFLTHGHMVSGHGASNWLKQAVGIPKEWPTPQVPQVTDYLSERCLQGTWDHVEITHSAVNYSQPGQGRSSVSYYALGLAPRQRNIGSTSG